MRSLAVFRPGLERSTYQQNQINLLESIEESLSSIYRNDLSILGALEHTVPNAIFSASSILLEGINDIWNGGDLSNTISRISNYTPEVIAVLHDMERTQEQILEDIQEPPSPPDNPSGFSLRESLDSLRDTIEGLNLDKLLNKAIDSANGFTELMNQTIQMTGATREESQQFRRDIVSQVGDLNEDIGNKLNSREVLSSMIAISNQTSISNRETLEEIMTPMVLAQETMDVNIGEFSKLAARFYTRYDFTSGNLEDLVDHMRNSTKDKDVSEQLLVEALDRTEDRIAILAQGDKDLMQKMNESLATGVAWAGSNYLDPNVFVDDIYRLMSPNVVERNEVAHRYGAHTTELQELVNSGNSAEAMARMAEIIAGYSSTQASALGIDTDTYERIKASELFGGLTTLEEYLASIEESQTARESLDDKFISIGDQINNALTDIGSYLSTVQETLGVGFDDVAGMLYIWKSMNLSSIFSGVLSKAGLSMTGTGVATGLAGTLGKFLPALGVGAVAVGGLAWIASNIYSEVQEDKDETAGMYQDALSTPSEHGYGLKGIFDETTGQTKWTYGALTAEEAANYDEDAALKQYLEDSYKQQGWQTKTWNFLTGGGVGDSGKFGKWDDEQIEAYESVKSILNTNPELHSFYAGKGLLDDLDEILEFSKHIDTYEDAFAKGMYKASDGEWYYTGDNAKVPSDLEPNSYAVGANYIPQDQLAYLHKGEAVVPEKYNPSANLNELERLREESSKDDESLYELLGAVQEIKEFLRYWKEDNNRSEALKSSRTRSTSRESVYNYLRY